MVDLFELLVGKEGEKEYQKKPVIVQGITGKFGSFHTQQMLAYGTNIVAGVTPGKGGQKIEGVPIYETMKDAVNASGAKISIVFVPAKFFLSAAVEARSEEHTSELQSQSNLVCRLLLEKKKKKERRS